MSETWFTENQDFWEAVWEIDSYEDLVHEEPDEWGWFSTFKCRQWRSRWRAPFRARANSECLPEPRGFEPVCKSGNWVEPTSSDIYGCAYPLRQGSQALTLDGNDVGSSEFQDHNAAQLWVFNRDDPYQIWSIDSMGSRKGWKALGAKDVRGCGLCWKECITDQGAASTKNCDDKCKDPCGLKTYTSRRSGGTFQRGTDDFRATSWQLSMCSSEEHKCALSLRAMQNELQGWEMPSGLELLPTFYLSLENGPRLVTAEVNKFKTGQYPMFDLKDDVPIITFGDLEV